MKEPPKFQLDDVVFYEALHVHGTVKHIERQKWFGVFLYIYGLETEMFPDFYMLVSENNLVRSVYDRADLHDGRTG